MKQQIKETLTHVLVYLTIFLVAILVYKINNPYSYPELENRTLFVLVLSGIALLYLYLEERENRNRLFSVIMVTAGRLRESKFMRICEGIWMRCSPLIRTRASKVLAELYTCLHKIFGYMLKQDPKQVVSYVFLAMLMMVALQSIFPQPSLEWARTPLMIAAVALGAITFYLNRDKLDEIEDEARQEELDENRRAMEFAGKYPRINRVWGVRWIVRWMYKEGWWYSWGLIVIVLIGFGMRIYNLEKASLNVDEAISSITAIGILHTGKPIFESTGLLNVHGLLHAYSIALSFKLFGISDFTARMPSVIFGTISIILIYVISKEISCNKIVSISTAFLYTLSIWSISISQDARMYQQLSFLYLITFFAFIYFVKNKMILQFIVMILLIISTYLTQRIGLVLIPTIIITSLILYPYEINIFFNKYVRNKLKSLCSIILIIILFSYEHGIKYDHFLFGITNNTLFGGYFSFVPINYFINNYFILFLFFSINVGIILSNIKNNRVASSALFFILIPLFMIDYLIFPNVPHDRVRYFYITFPFFLILSLDGLGKIRYIFSKITYKKISYCCLLIFVVSYPLLNDSYFTYSPKPILKDNMVVSDFKNVNQYISNMTDYNDLIIISNPTPTAYYYFGHVDYWLNSHQGESTLYTYEKNGTRVDVYANATLVSNLKNLKTIVNNSVSGVIIIEKYRYRFIDKDIKSWISINLEQIDSVSNNYIDVYYWNQSCIDKKIEINMD